jgi:hypothetical protein
MPLLIKTGKLKSVENISYATPHNIYKKYVIGTAPILFTLSPLTVEEGKTYLAVIDCDLEKGEGKPLAIVPYEKSGSINELAGVIHLRKSEANYFAGRFPVEFDVYPTEEEFPLVVRAKFSGKKIKVERDNKGNAVLIYSL